MRVAETAETLDYIKGSKKPHKVRSFYTQFLRLELRYTFMFLCPNIDLSVGVQTTQGAPLPLQVQSV